MKQRKHVNLRHEDCCNGSVLKCLEAVRAKPAPLIDHCIWRPSWHQVHRLAMVLLPDLPVCLGAKSHKLSLLWLVSFAALFFVRFNGFRSLLGHMTCHSVSQRVTPCWATPSTISSEALGLPPGFEEATRPLGLWSSLVIPKSSPSHPCRVRIWVSTPPRAHQLRGTQLTALCVWLF